jgi:chromosome segregation ATPase
LSPSFDFIRNRFKSKTKKEPKVTSDLGDEPENEYDLNDPNLQKNATKNSQQLIEQAGKAISIKDATNRLRVIQEQETTSLVHQFAPIRNSAQASLQSIVDLAGDLQNEEIKVEDQRFESTVENARNTVITSILKDANSSFAEIASYDDVIKFKDRLESLTNRFGQLTGSHSKLFNVFLKKYADKFRSEFEDFSNLNKKASKLIENYDRNLKDTNSCTERIGRLSENLESLRCSKEKIADLSREIEGMEEDVKRITRRRQDIEQSEEYKNYSRLEAEARELEKTKAEFRDYVSDLFSHLNRAFTKYSYGVSKSVVTRIDMLSSTPWEIFLNPRSLTSDSSSSNIERSKEDHQDVESYRTLLIEIRGAVGRGTISLKDSEKVLTYLDKAIETFPKIESRGWEIQKKAFGIKRTQDREAFNSIKSLDEEIRRTKNDIAEKKILIAEIERTVQEKNIEIQNLSEECNYLLTEILGQEKIISVIPE